MANTTVNASIRVLAATIADNRSVMESLLLSSNPILSADEYVHTLSGAFALNHRLHHLALEDCNFSSSAVALMAPK